MPTQRRDLEVQRSYVFFTELISHAELYSPPLEVTKAQTLISAVQDILHNVRAGDSTLAAILWKTIPVHGRLSGAAHLNALSGLAAILSTIHLSSIAHSSHLVRSCFRRTIRELESFGPKSLNRGSKLYSAIILFGMLIHERVISAEALLVLWQHLRECFVRILGAGLSSPQDAMDLDAADWTLHAALDIAYITGDILAKEEPGSKIYTGLCLFKERLRRAIWEGVLEHHAQPCRMCHISSERSLAERAVIFVEALDRNGAGVLQRNAHRASTDLLKEICMPPELKQGVHRYPCISLPAFQNRRERVL